MESRVEKPSLFRIITIDRFSFMTLAAPIVVWGLFGALSYFGFLPDLRWGRDPLTRESIPIMLNMAIIATGLAIPLFVWRVWTVWSTLTRGIEVPGQIVEVLFFRDRGRVEYTYTFEGHAHRRGNGIMRTKRTKALKPNNEVVLRAHPRHPKRAYIRDLYLS